MPSPSSEDVAVALPLPVSLVTTLTTIVIHGIALIAALHTVHREYLLGRAGFGFWRDVAIVAMVIQLALASLRWWPIWSRLRSGQPC